MTRRAKHRRRRSNEKVRSAPQPTQPVDEIPDVTKRRSRWKYAVIAAVFLAWAAFLLYCGLAGGL